ncbi:MAG TPA: Ig-like domain-containing protein, partial [Terriglobales bacterium]
MSGLIDSSGQSFDRLGSNDPDLEGYFDLGGLEIPDGADAATYQITVEPVDPLLSQAVGPYGPWQVQPSGAPVATTVTIARGGDLQQDILMLNSALPKPDWFGPQSFASPAPVPAGGEWAGSLSGYGDADYFRFSGRTDRTLSVEVTALNESGSATQSKAMPVIGIWTLANPGGLAESGTPLAFNGSPLGTTRLDVALAATTDFRMGISDYRGDGRPDFRYRARIFYADHIAPSRSSAGGGSAFIAGFGFRANTSVRIGGVNAPPLGVSGNRMLVAAPPKPDGIQNVDLSDPATGASSTMTGVLIYGAAPTDTIKFFSGPNPPIPVGGEAPNPIRVQVLAADGVTPVAGATVRLLSTPAVAFSACGGVSSCSVLTDQSGQIVTRATLLAAGATTITAQLAPASYSPPKQVQATLVSSPAAVVDIALSSPGAWIASGATLDVPLIARVLSSGTPQSGRVVNYQLTQGSATLSSSTGTTDAGGFAATTLHIAAMAGEVQVNACVAPDNKPCQAFHAFSVAASSLRLQPVAGSLQYVPAGQSFQPVTLRVLDT